MKVDQSALAASQSPRENSEAQNRPVLPISTSRIAKAVHDMGWPDLLVSDVMVMMAADDCRG
jgi:hypothetical protein